MKTESARSATAGKSKATAKKKAGRKAAQTAKADKGGLREILGKILDSLEVIAARQESIRRTMWRMSEVREYQGKGEKKDAGEQAADRDAIALLVDFLLPVFKQLKADVASGRVNITGTVKQADVLDEAEGFSKREKAANRPQNAEGAE